MYASKIVSYAQGFMLLREAANVFGWKLNYGGIALMWRGGCIIRSVFLGDIKAAYEKNPELDNLLLDDFFKNAIHEAQSSWRKVCKLDFFLDLKCRLGTIIFRVLLALFDPCTIGRFIA